MVISSTEFWGVEVPPGVKGVKVKVEASDNAMEYIHIQQAALGEYPGSGKSVLYANVGKTQFALGTLERGRTDMFQLEIIMDTSFRLTHTGKAPVYITGYRTQALDEDLLLDYDTGDEDEDSEDAQDEEEDDGESDDIEDSDGDDTDDYFQFDSLEGSDDFEEEDAGGIQRLANGDDYDSEEDSDDDESEDSEKDESDSEDDEDEPIPDHMPRKRAKSGTPSKASPKKTQKTPLKNKSPRIR